MEQTEFMRQLMEAADIPANAPSEIVSVSRDYYRHPVGTYLGVMGPFVYKYTDISGNKCEPTDPGAMLRRIVQRIYIIKFFGSTEAPGEVELFPNFPTIPTNVDVKAEKLYYPLVLMTDPKYAWKANKLFQDFVIPQIGDASKLVHPSKNPQVKGDIFDNKNLALYNGCYVKLEIVNSSKGNPYLDNISLVNQPRIPIPDMNKLKEDMDKMIKAEIEARKAEENKLSNTGAQTQQAQSAVDSVDSMFQTDNSGFDTDDNDDLPF